MAVSDPIRMLITRRPDWLPDGHAFCPGKREKIGLRTWRNDPSVTQNVLTCEHGQWFDIASAWTDHQQFAPIPASAEHLAILPERAGREGDTQELPIGTDEEDTQSVAIRLIQSRRLLGIKRYGQALQPSNGRDSMVDLVEELLDALVYALNEWRSRNPGKEFPGL